MSNYDKDVENIYRQCGLDYLLDEISYDNNALNNKINTKLATKFKSSCEITGCHNLSNTTQIIRFE